MPIAPDDKDWTWVLQRPCPECGFDATRIQATAVGGRIRESADRFVGALIKPDARRRPRPDKWSPTEYACHVRDVHIVFAQRLRLMLEEDGPEFANWDQDATALLERYGDQVPGAVAEQLLDAASDVAALYDGVPDSAWHRAGSRSNGSEFTVDSLARYHLHDVVHHLWDVEADASN